MGRAKEKKYKIWPQDQPVSFRDLVTSVVDVIKFGYKMERIKRNRNIPYKGYNIGEHELVGDFDPIEKLKVERLKYAEDEQGRDLLRTAVGISVQLGIEQGRRMANKDNKEIIEMIKKLLSMIK